MLTEPYHDPTGDEMEFKYFCALADKFERKPELLGKALEIADRWLAMDAHGSRHVNRYIGQWRDLIANAMTAPYGLSSLIEVLRNDDEDTRFLKGFAPFPGILTQEEYRPFLCASRH
jgi:hypothetical protein